MKCFVIVFVTLATIWKWNWTHSCTVRVWSKPLPRGRIGHFKHYVETKKSEKKPKTKYSKETKRTHNPRTRNTFHLHRCTKRQTEKEEEQKKNKRNKIIHITNKEQTKINNGLIDCFLREKLAQIFISIFISTH